MSELKKIDNSFLWITLAGLLCKKIQMISDYYLKYIETFRCEKSAWNNYVSGTRNYWDLKLNN